MKHASLEDFRYIWEYPNWSIVILRVFVMFFNTGIMLAFFNIDEKLGFSVELLKFETRTLANISTFFNRFS